jgi:23S rRNA (adenine2503-C2)-methyltransferase
MISGPVMVQALEGEGAIAKNRELMGATDPEEGRKPARSAPISPTVHRRQCRAWFRRAGDRRGRDRLLLPGAERLSPADRRNDRQPPRFRCRWLGAWFAQRGEKPFRARQVMRWMHQRGEGDFSAMTDLAKSLRRDSMRTAIRVARRRLQRSTVARRHAQVAVRCGATATAVETVFIPEDDRGTLCVSSQAGCALECAFCSTGRQGFNRNLSTAEIIGQLWQANRALGADAAGIRRIISNVVMMGMGEPLANSTMPRPGPAPDARRQRLRLVAPPGDRVDLGHRAGHGPPRGRAAGGARRLAACAERRLRDRLVPINRKYPLAELMAACRRYLVHAPRDFITFEYVMLDGVNDSRCRCPRSAASGARCALQVQPDSLQSVSGFRLSPFAGGTGSAIRRHSDADAGIVTTTRKTRGDDIDAACGQLAGKVKDKSLCFSLYHDRRWQPGGGKASGAFATDLQRAAAARKEPC